MADCTYIIKHKIGSTRYDVIESSENYPLFECNRKTNGELWFYIGSWQNNNCRPDRDTKMKFTIRQFGHLTKIKQINTQFAIGDIKTTTDLVIFRIIDDWDIIQVFIFKGKKHDEDLFIQELICNDIDLLNMLDSKSNSIYKRGV